MERVNVRAREAANMSTQGLARANGDKDKEARAKAKANMAAKEDGAK